MLYHNANGILWFVKKLWQEKNTLYNMFATESYVLFSYDFFDFAIIKMAFKVKFNHISEHLIGLF